MLPRVSLPWVFPDPHGSLVGRTGIVRSFIGEESEAQRGSGTVLRSHSKGGANWGWNPYRHLLPASILHFLLYIRSSCCKPRLLWLLTTARVPRGGASGARNRPPSISSQTRPLGLMMDPGRRGGAASELPQAFSKQSLLLSLISMVTGGILPLEPA